VWEDVRDMLDVNPSLQAKTVFAYLKRQRPGLFQDGQLRTLQRRVKSWRALEGPAKEVFRRSTTPVRSPSPTSRAWTVSA
jgi:hypothetical protein